MGAHACRHRCRCQIQTARSPGGTSSGPSCHSSPSRARSQTAAPPAEAKQPVMLLYQAGGVQRLLCTVQASNIVPGQRALLLAVIHAPRVARYAWALLEKALNRQHSLLFLSPTLGKWDPQRSSTASLPAAAGAPAPGTARRAARTFSVALGYLPLLPMLLGDSLMVVRVRPGCPAAHAASSGQRLVMFVQQVHSLHPVAGILSTI